MRRAGQEEEGFKVHPVEAYSLEKKKNIYHPQGLRTFMISPARRNHKYIFSVNSVPQAESSKRARDNISYPNVRCKPATPKA